MVKEISSLDKEPDITNDKNNSRESTAEETGNEKPDTPEDTLQQLREQLRQKDEELKKQRDEFLRLLAETDNFKKRMSREKNEFAQFANEKLIKDLLPVYENLQRAITSPNLTLDSLKEGVEMILKQFFSFLEKQDVEPISAIDEKFDPGKHEALHQIESGEHEDSTVIEEYSRGYTLKGRVILPARVVVSKKPAEPGTSGTPSGDTGKDGKNHDDSRS